MKKSKSEKEWIFNWERQIYTTNNKQQTTTSIRSTHYQQTQPLNENLTEKKVNKPLSNFFISYLYQVLLPLVVMSDRSVNKTDTSTNLGSSLTKTVSPPLPQPPTSIAQTDSAKLLDTDPKIQKF